MKNAFVAGTFVAIAALGVCACRRESPEPTGAAPSASASPTPALALGRMRGRWEIKLSAQQERDLATLRMVFEEQDPSPERLATLSDAERATILSVREARKRSPDDPQYQEMRAVLEGMGRSELVINTSSITLIVGAVKQDADFVVSAQTATSVTFRATNRAGRTERVVLNETAPDELSMSKPNQPEALSFRRRR